MVHVWAAVDIWDQCLFIVQTCLTVCEMFQMNEV